MGFAGSPTELLRGARARYPALSPQNAVGFAGPTDRWWHRPGGGCGLHQSWMQTGEAMPLSATLPNKALRTWGWGKSSAQGGARSPKAAPGGVGGDGDEARPHHGWNRRQLVHGAGLYWSVLVCAGACCPPSPVPLGSCICSHLLAPLLPKTGQTPVLAGSLPHGDGGWEALEAPAAAPGTGLAQRLGFLTALLGLASSLPAPSPRGGAEGNTSTTRSCFSWWVSPVLSCPPPAFVLLPPTLGLAAQAAPCAPQCLPCAVTLGRGWVKNNPTNPLYPRIPFFIPRSPFPRRKKAQSQRSEPEALPQNPGCPPPPTHSEGHRAGRAAGEGAGGSTGGSSRPAPGRGQSFCQLSSCRWC